MERITLYQIKALNSRYIYVCLNFKEALLSLFNLLQNILFGEPARQDFQEVHGSTQATQPKSRACGNCGELGHKKTTCKNAQRVSVASGGQPGGGGRPVAALSGSRSSGASSSSGRRRTPQEPKENACDSDQSLSDEEMDANVPDLEVDEDDSNEEEGEFQARAESENEHISVKDFTIENKADPTTRSGLTHTVDASLRPAFLGSGPKASVGRDVKTELDFFELFMTDDFIETFVTSTNGYAASTGFRPRGDAWKDVTADDIWVFIGIVIFMGTIDVPIRRSFWDRKSPYFNEFIASKMSCRRFEDILHCFHWVNTAQYSSDEKLAKNKEDNFWQVGGYLDSLAALFRLYYDPGQDLDVDEGSIPAKCYHTAIQYNKDKPYKWFFKVFCLNCTKSQYLWNFYLYRGKDVERPDTTPSTAYPVLKLCDFEKFRHKNFIMFVDNWFNSVYLLLKLLERGIHSCGTIRTNRVVRRLGVSKDWFLKGDKVARGTMKAKQVSLNQKCIFLVSWKDNKVVNMITTFKTYKESAQRYNKAKKASRATRIEIARPTCVRVYNKGMGGTDGFDGMIARYRLGLQTKRWPHRVLFHFFNASMVNAHVLFKTKHAIDRGHKSFTKLGFSTSLIEQILEKHLPKEPEGSEDEDEAPPPKKMRRACSFTDEERLQWPKNAKHFSIYVPVKDSPDLYKGEHNCRYPGCGSRVRTFCQDCFIPLCCTLIDGTSCHAKWHTLKTLT